MYALRMKAVAEICIADECEILPQKKTCIEQSFGPNLGDATHSCTIFAFLIVTPTHAIVTKVHHESQLTAKVYVAERRLLALTSQLAEKNKEMKLLKENFKKMIQTSQSR